MATLAGRIQFRLCTDTDGRNWRMPVEAEPYELEGVPHLVGNDCNAKSQFWPMRPFEKRKLVPCWLDYAKRFAKSSARGW